MGRSIRYVLRGDLVRSRVGGSVAVPRGYCRTVTSRRDLTCNERGAEPRPARAACTAGCRAAPRGFESAIPERINPPTTLGEGPYRHCAGMPPVASGQTGTAALVFNGQRIAQSRHARNPRRPGRRHAGGAHLRENETIVRDSDGPDIAEGARRAHDCKRTHCRWRVATRAWRVIRCDGAVAHRTRLH